jgi:hypothetical protein
VTTGDIVLASTSDAGIKGNGGSYLASLSADGNRVSFVSGATNLDPADTVPASDLYVKDLTTGDIMLAATSDTGIKGNGGIYVSDYPLSADGSRVVFSSSATNLDPADTDSLYDVYVKNLNTGNIDLSSRSDTGVKGNGHSVAEGSLSADGRIVAFVSQRHQPRPRRPRQPARRLRQEPADGRHHRGVHLRHGREGQRPERRAEAVGRWHEGGVLVQGQQPRPA